jgi:hypothetical protein
LFSAATPVALSQQLAGAKKNRKPMKMQGKYQRLLLYIMNWNFKNQETWTQVS